jgi:uncharacterized protein (DUF1501 family)
MLDGLNAINKQSYELVGDPSIQTRIQQYEMAFRMQASVPELVDLSDEPEHIHSLYGEESKERGTFANSALMARRLLERGTRFVQIFHRGWDHHSILPEQLPGQAYDVDQPSAALIRDLKQRGLLEDTIVVMAGEFGRTPFCQGNLKRDDYGRDHHPRCFTGWAAGGGFKGGMSYGETDDFSYNVVKDPVPIRDFHATLLHQLGIDHERLVYPFQGLDQKLTGVEPAKVVKDIVT